MTAILNVLGSGFSAKKIIDFFIRKNPEIGEKIKTLLASGFSAEQILKFFSKGDNFDKLRSQMENSYSIQNNANPLVQSEEIRGRNLTNDPASMLQRSAGPLARSALTAGAGLLGSYALSRALPGIVQQFAPGMTQNVPTGPTPQQIAQNVPKQIQQQAAPVINPAAPAPVPVPVKASQVLDELGIKERVDNMLKAGNTPEAISTVLSSIGKKKFKTDEELASTIAQYAQEKPSEPVQKAQNEPQLQKASGLPEQAEQPKEETPIQAKSTVILPSGDVGEVKSIKNGIATIEVNGVDKTRKVDDLDQSPLNTDELADKYDALFAAIPEKERSAFISWAGYDEDTNTLGFIPRGGKYEEISNISPEYAQAIKDATGQARTSGEKREGLWIAGESTRGGLIYNLIEKIQNDKKAAKERNPEFSFVESLAKPEKTQKGMVPIFDEMSFARQASRDREKRIREETKAKKKAEKQKLKDEEKARKKRKKQA